METERRKDTCRSQWRNPPLTQPLTTFPAPTSASQAFSFLRPQVEPYASRPGKTPCMKSCLMEPSAHPWEMPLSVEQGSSRGKQLTFCPEVSPSRINPVAPAKDKGSRTLIPEGGDSQLYVAIPYRPPPPPRSSRAQQPR